jgi:hypothetical protein
MHRTSTRSIFDIYGHPGPQDQGGKTRKQAREEITCAWRSTGGNHTARKRYCNGIADRFARFCESSISNPSFSVSSSCPCRPETAIAIDLAAIYCRSTLDNKRGHPSGRGTRDVQFTSDVLHAGTGSKLNLTAVSGVGIRTPRPAGPSPTHIQDESAPILTNTKVHTRAEFVRADAKPKMQLSVENI